MTMTTTTSWNQQLLVQQNSCNNPRTLRRSYNTTSQLLKVYEENETSSSSSISEQEQELIKAELASLTGNDAHHLRLFQKLESAKKEMQILLNQEEKKKEWLSPQTVIAAMQTTATAHWELGMLDEANSLQQDILERLIDLHSSLDNKNISAHSHGTRDIPIHWDVARTFHAIGAIQSRSHAFDEAQKWFEKTLELKRELLVQENVDNDEREHHFEIGKTLNGMALNIVQKAHAEEDVESHYTHIVSLMEEAISNYHYHGCDPQEIENGSVSGGDMKDHPDLVSLHENLATIYRQCNEYDLAHKNYEEALRIQQHHLAENVEALTNYCNERVVSLLLDVADCLKALERYEEALENYEFALEEHLLVAQKERSLQVDSGNQNQSDEKALLLENSHSERTIMEGVLRHNIGVMNAELDRKDEAMEEYKTSIAIKKALLGENHIEVANTLNAIGALLGSKAEFEPALAYFREALYIYEKNSTSAFGDEGDEHIMNTKKNIALVENRRKKSNPF